MVDKFVMGSLLQMSVFTRGTEMFLQVCFERWIWKKLMIGRTRVFLSICLVEWVLVRDGLNGLGDVFPVRGFLF